ncbi:MAG: CHAD domain-containing protein [Gammaproteobacteria bacterium]|nr:CHAD domain-containing protein [Gammaproteobacteria bacterium]
MAAKIQQYTIPETCVDLESALIRAFPLERQSPQWLHRLYKDTFDGRLYQKKYLFWQETRESFYDVFVHNFKTGERLQSTACEDVVWPAVIESSVLGRKIQAITKIRALMPQISVSVKQHILHYLGGDEKTQLRLIIEYSQLMRPDGSIIPLDKRLLLLPVRGYDKPLKAVARYLERVHGLRLSQDNPLLHAMSAADQPLSRYSNTFQVGLDPEMPTDQAFKRILLDCLENMEKNETGVIEGIDSEFLHDLRVSVRRTRALLSQIPEAFPKKVLNQFEPSFAWVGKITGPLRDLDVYLLKFNDYQQALPVTEGENLMPLKRFLTRQQKIEQKKLARLLQSGRYQQLKSEWRTFLEKKDMKKPPSAVALQTVKRTADRYVWQAYKKLLKRGQVISPECPDKKLHRLRINAKKVRYLLDFFQTLYPSARIQPLMKQLKKLQDVLGDFQDLSVQAHTLQQFESQMEAERQLTPETTHAIALLIQHFDARLEQQRGAFFNQFEQFSEAAHQVESKALFHSVEGEGAA